MNPVINKEEINHDLEKFKQTVEDFSASGIKTHRMITGSHYIEITDYKSQAEYIVDYFSISRIWKRIMSTRNYELAISKVTSANEVAVNYDNGKIYLKDEIINIDKILEDLNYVKEFGDEGLQSVLEIQHRDRQFNR